MVRNGLDVDLLFRGASVQEDGSFGAANVRDTSPLSLVSLERLAVLRQCGLERVRFAGKVALALVVDGSGESSRRLNGGRVGELDVRRTPDDALNSELS